MKNIVNIYENKSFETIQFFSSRPIFDKLSVQGQMIDQEGNIDRGKIVFDDKKQERKSGACLAQT